MDSATKERDDVMRSTVEHVRYVGALLMQVVCSLQDRAIFHDHSKFTEAEYPAFAQSTPRLKGLTYGSDEYKAELAKLGPALEHHYRINDHHPEYHANGIHDMSLIELIEMLADWCAASKRHADGNLAKSITHNAKRFGYGRPMMIMLAKTAARLGWITSDEWEHIKGIEIIG